MLVNCPRCGLSQPKDKYCAKCGVDMETFRPSEPSGLQKIMFNPFLHVLVVFSLLAGTVLFIRERRREELKARMEYLNAGPLVVERARTQDNSPTELTQNPQDSKDGNPPPESAPPDVGPTSTSTTLASAPTAMAPPNTDSSINSARGLAQKPALTRSFAIYAEVDRSTVKAWLDEMKAKPNFRSFDQVSAGVLSDIGQKLRSSGVKILQQIEHPIKPNAGPIDWFVGTHKGPDPDSEIGFYSSLVINDQRDGIVRGDIEIQRAFRDPSDPQKALDRISFGGLIDMPLGSGFVMRGLLPSRYAMDIEDDYNPDSFLSILKSRKFPTGEVEFIFILDFDSAPPAKQ